MNHPPLPPIKNSPPSIFTPAPAQTSPNNSINTTNQANFAPITSAPTINQPAPINTSKPPKSRHRLIAAIIILAILLLLGAGGAAAYYFYYQSDAKIFSDAWQQIMAAQSVGFAGTYSAQEQTDYHPSAESAPDTFNFTIEGVASYQAQEAKFHLQTRLPLLGEINVAAQTKHLSSGDLFLQVTGVGEALAAANFEGLFDANDLEKQWIRIGTQAIDEYAVAADLQRQKLSECLQNNWQTITTTSAINQEFLQAIISNNFITYKRLNAQQIAGKSAIGYELTPDWQQLPAVADNITQTQAFQLIMSCLPESIEVQPEDSRAQLVKAAQEIAAGIAALPAASLPRTTVWFDQRTHVLVRIASEMNHVDSTGVRTVTTTISATTDLQLNVPVDVQAPTDYKEIEELIAGLFANSNLMIPSLNDDLSPQIIGGATSISTINMQGEPLAAFPGRYSIQACSGNNERLFPGVTEDEPDRFHSNLDLNSDVFQFAFRTNCDAAPTDYRVESVYDEAADILYLDLLNEKTYADSGCTCVMVGNAEIWGLSSTTKRVLLNQEM